MSSSNYAYTGEPFGDKGYNFQEGEEFSMARQLRRMDKVYDGDGMQMGNIFFTDGKVRAIDVFQRSEDGTVKGTVTTRYDEKGNIAEVERFNHETNERTVFPENLENVDLKSLFPDATFRKDLREIRWQDKVYDANKEQIGSVFYKNDKVIGFNSAPQFSDGSRIGMNVSYNEQGKISGVSVADRYSQGYSVPTKMYGSSIETSSMRMMDNSKGR